MNITKRKTLLATTVALFAGGTQVAMAQDNQAAERQSVLDEIIVTATKRETSLQDTAGSIAAIGSAEIDARGLTGAEDYLRFVPSVSYLDRGASQTNINIRGITADPDAEQATAGSTVVVYMGEVPISNFREGGSSDIQLIDMERVEILRGPQGTLFGSGALGGTLRNIPTAPNLTELEGNIKTGYAQTSGHGDKNTNLQGVINIPLLEDTLAIRAVAYRIDRSGYTKNIAGSHPGFADSFIPYGAETSAINEARVGDTEYVGGRISMLWKPRDELGITLQYITQDTEQDGFPDVQLGTGGYTQARIQFGSILGDSEMMKDDLDVSNLVVEYEFSWAKLLSSTSVAENESAINRDLSVFLGGIPTPQRIPTEAESFVQEVRLVSSLDGSFQYNVGLYYEDRESMRQSLAYFGGEDLSLSPFGTPFGSSNPLIFVTKADKNVQQKAIFGEFSYDVSEQLALTLGLRHFDYKRDSHLVDEGAFGSKDEILKTDESGNSYKANVSYQPDDNTLLYAQWAEGFRLGDVNPSIPLSTCDADNDGILDGTNTAITESYDSDGLETFELGAKLDLLDNTLRFNATLFHTNWQGIPIAITSPTCFFSVTSNAGEAVSQGAELESIWQLTEGLRLNVGASYVNAELTEDAPGLGVDGDRLPGSPDYNLSLGLQYDFTLYGYQAFIRSDYAYISGFHTDLQELSEESGDFGQLNLGAGIRIDNISLDLAVTNATNEDDLTWVSTAAFADARAWRLRPRTVGLTLGYQF